MLSDDTIGRYQVQTCVDRTAEEMRGEIARFSRECEPGDLALIVITGHAMQTDLDEYVLVASDTRRGEPETGVPAAFVDDRLESCVAANRILMLDTCHAGAFTLGFRTTEAKSTHTAAGPRRLTIQDRGVHVLASSDAAERSFTRRDGPADEVLSVFVGAVVDVLREGAAGSSARAEVSVDDLFGAVTTRLDGADPPQTPVRSALRSAGQVAIAYRPRGTGRVAARRADVAAEDGAEPSGPPPWSDVLRYLTSVLETESRMELLSPDDDAVTVLTGRERVLSGRVDEDGCIPVPAGFDSTGSDQDTLWAGWPCVVIRVEGRWRFAPLLIREAELDANRSRLRPVGDAVPHPGLAQHVLEDQAGPVLEAFGVRWRSGEAEVLAEEAGRLLDGQYGIDLVHQLRPDHLADDLDLRTPAEGARNVAVLFRGSGEEFTGKLQEDLRWMINYPRDVEGSAATALVPGVQPDPPGPSPYRMVTPLATNPAQLRVLLSAMTQRLTVATGPPGTGKSQLVTNAVATAVASGQTVLVASSNNTAVDEVAERCTAVAPGLLVRTGAKPYLREETRVLTDLLNAPATPGPTRTTRELGVDAAAQRLAALVDATAEQAERERLLLDAVARVTELMRELGVDPTTLASRLGASWGARSGRLADAWFFGSLRRRRWLELAGVDASDDPARTCRLMAELAVADGTRRNLRARLEDHASDEQLRTDLARARDEHRARCLELARAIVPEDIDTGRGAIEQLARSEWRRWEQRESVLPHLRGWALTSLTARRFRLRPQFDLVIIDEASQCGVAAVLPLLARARRALVIGDPMQLPPISKLDPRADRRLRRRHGVPAAWLTERRMAPRRHSAYDAVERAAGPALLLDEHYRCAPAIADLSNRLFYSGRLTVLTDVHAPGRATVDDRPIIWRAVRGKPVRSGSSWMNPDEVNVVVTVVRALGATHPAGTSVGVVTPYRPQADAIRAALGSLAEPKKVRDPSGGLVRVGTAHAFQGGERDIMVFSLVGADDGGNPERFGWADRERRLWNVAITRARSQLIVVGDHGFWSGRPGVGAALAEATAARDPVGAPVPGEHLRRLHARLTAEHPDADFTVDRDGYRVDAVVPGPDGGRAYLIDPGARAGADPGEHLQVMLRRAELLGHRVTRVPAWTLHEPP